MTQAILLIVIGGIRESFELVGELASLKRLHGTTTGEDLFLSVCEAMKELELPWTKLKGGDNRWSSKYDWKENNFDGWN
jgi:hypothetical protein